jgi:nicotinamidase-related amidase
VTLSIIDPETALVIIDLQKGVVAMDTVHAMDGVIARSRELADAFRECGLPVVLVNVSGAPSGRTERSRAGSMERPEGWDELIPELDQQPSDHLVTKRTRGAFTNTDLESYLRREGVTQIVLTGVATSAGVESTARHAHELGFNVTLATDAMTDMSSEVHDNSVERIFPGLGETGTTAEILALLSETRA